MVLCTCPEMDDVHFTMKEGNNFQNERSSTTPNALPRFTKLPPEELQSLIAKAQAYEQEAIDKLCALFQPLINKEARRLNVQEILGEDAVNTAWVIFLNFIHRYNGTDYQHLPGLIQCRLRYELLHKVQKEGRSSESNSASEDLMEMQPHELLEQSLTNLAVQEVLETLPTRQHQILSMYYIDKKNLEQIAERFNCNEKTIRRQKLEAIKRFKEKFTT